MLTFATNKLSTGATWNSNGQKEDAASFCPRSFDRAVIVAQWYDLRLERGIDSKHPGRVSTRNRDSQYDNDSGEQRVWAPPVSVLITASVFWKRDSPGHHDQRYFLATSLRALRRRWRGRAPLACITRSAMIRLPVCAELQLEVVVCVQQNNYPGYLSVSYALTNAHLEGWDVLFSIRICYMAYHMIT